MRWLGSKTLLTPTPVPAFGDHGELGALAQFPVEEDPKPGPSRWPRMLPMEGMSVKEVTQAQPPVELIPVVSILFFTDKVTLNSDL